MSLQLSSPAFDDGATIPDRYGKAHGNENPPLTVAGVPDGAESLALVVDDPDAPNGVFDHWLVWDLPPDVHEIPEGWTPPREVTQGTNDFGERGYGGPKPPSEHTYRFKLYALDAELGLPPTADKGDLVEAMDGHVLDQDLLRGRFAP